MPKLKLTPARVMTVAEVASLARVSGKTVREAIAAERLRADKLPGQTGAWLIASADALAWISARDTSA